jgi:hypothetical protein
MARPLKLPVCCLLLGGLTGCVAAAPVAYLGTKAVAEVLVDRYLGPAEGKDQAAAELPELDFEASSGIAAFGPAAPIPDLSHRTPAAPAPARIAVLPTALEDRLAGSVATELKSAGLEVVGPEAVVEGLGTAALRLHRFGGLDEPAKLALLQQVSQTLDVGVVVLAELQPVARPASAPADLDSTTALLPELGSTTAQGRLRLFSAEAEAIVHEEAFALPLAAPAAQPDDTVLGRQLSDLVLRRLGRAVPAAPVS